jgi:hypothetical protein
MKVFSVILVEVHLYMPNEALVLVQTITGRSQGDGEAITPIVVSAASPRVGGRFWALSDLEEDDVELPLHERSSIYLRSGTCL